MFFVSQAVIKQFSGRFGHDSVVADGAELSCYQKLQTLFDSTKAAKVLYHGTSPLHDVSQRHEVLKACKISNETALI